VLPGQRYCMVIDDISNFEEEITSLSRIFENKIFRDAASRARRTDISFTTLRKPTNSHCQDLC
jgi:hypothetical protein